MSELAQRSGTEAARLRSHYHLTTATPVEAFKLGCQSGVSLHADAHAPQHWPMCCRMRLVPRAAHVGLSYS